MNELVARLREAAKDTAEECWHGNRSEPDYGNAACCFFMRLSCLLDEAADALEVPA